jgi:hypothetical protein
MEIAPMEPVTEALRLLQHLAKLERMMRSPGGIRITQERELHVLKAQLEKLPSAAQAVLVASQQLHRPVEALSVHDVEMVEGGIH